MKIQASYVLQFFAIWCTSQKSFHFSLCETASVLICRNTWCFTWNIWESLLRLFPFLNADKHSPASSARSTKRRVSGCFCQWESKAPTDTNKSQPTTYCFAQLKQATCLIRLKCIFMHEHNQAGMPNWFVAIAYSGKSHLTWLLSRNVYCAFCVSVLILSIHLSFSIFIPISL